MENVTEIASNREQAHAITKRHALYTGTVAIVPMPLIEFGLVPGIQLRLVYELTKLYNVPFSNSIAKSLLASITGSGITILGNAALTSLLKGVPILGQVTGLMTAGISGGTTWAIGKVFTEHFETGGTLLTIDADKIKAHYETLLNNTPSALSDPKSFAGIPP